MCKKIDLDGVIDVGGPVGRWPKFSPTNFQSSRNSPNGPYMSNREATRGTSEPRRTCHDEGRPVASAWKVPQLLDQLYSSSTCTPTLREEAQADTQLRSLPYFRRSFDSHQLSPSRRGGDKEEIVDLMPIKNAAEAGFEKSRFGEEAEDRRGQDLRAQEQEQEQKCAEVRPEPPAIRTAQAWSL